jgi:hypothetical protein
MLGRAGLLTLLAALPWPVGGCAGSVPGANRPLPSYVGHAVELFDDAIEPGAVGLDAEVHTDPRGDATVRERAQLSDAVLRVRTTTLTAKQDGAETFYQLSLRTLENLGGPFPPGDAFSVTLGPKSRSIGIVKNLEDAIVGKSFIAFVSAFVLPDGDRELHFHLSPDTKPEAAAVRESMQKTER